MSFQKRLGIIPLRMPRNGVVYVFSLLDGAKRRTPIFKPVSSSPCDSGGFTLVELMIVIAIIGILAAAASITFMHARDRAKVGACKATLGSIRIGMENYYADNTGYPLGNLTYADLITELSTNMKNLSPDDSNSCEFISYISDGRIYTLETQVQRTTGVPATLTLTESDLKIVE